MVRPALLRLAVPALLALPAAGGCGEKTAGTMAEERAAFELRCLDHCKANGFRESRMKETEVVSETVERACYCGTAGRWTDAPRFTEKGPR